MAASVLTVAAYVVTRRCECHDSHPLTLCEPDSPLSLCPILLGAALKSPAAFHEQRRSLERARVSAVNLPYTQSKQLDMRQQSLVVPQKIN